MPYRDKEKRKLLIKFIMKPTKKKESLL